MLRRLLPDTFTLALLGTVLLATMLPLAGSAAQELDRFTDWAIAGLFFLHSARLPREAIVAGLLHWRLHLLILACTFLLFPLLGAGSAADVASDYYSPVIFLVLGGSLIALAIERVGLHRRIALGIVKRGGTSPRALMERHVETELDRLLRR